jgi:16S rRNA (guanine966-N2)-methyltransferase
MRIVGGAWKGKLLVAPTGLTTRPTSDRVRQAIFDMLWHAPWAGREVIEGARVLDGFAGTGAMGLEALSRGAAEGWFIERDRAALAALRENVARCGVAVQVIVGDVLRPPKGAGCGLVFLDPPYGGGLVVKALGALRAAGWIAPDALVVAEVGRDEEVEGVGEVVAERAHGAARVLFLREA